ncbi:unnamed protein product [Ectocarpus sp. 12 AP-2014]
MALPIYYIEVRLCACFLVSIYSASRLTNGRPQSFRYKSRTRFLVQGFYWDRGRVFLLHEPKQRCTGHTDPELVHRNVNAFDPTRPAGLTNYRTRTNLTPT